MSADGAVYLDSSALVKLLVTEAETAALLAHLRGGGRRAACALVRVEVVRAARAKDAGMVPAARRVMTGLDLIDVDGPLLDAAADLEDRTLRSLDAIHVAAACSLGDDLAELVTYDRRMADAARGVGLPVLAPS